MHQVSQFFVLDNLFTMLDDTVRIPNTFLFIYRDLNILCIKYFLYSLC